MLAPQLHTVCSVHGVLLVVSVLIAATCESRDICLSPQDFEIRNGGEPKYGLGCVEWKWGESQGTVGGKLGLRFLMAA